MNMNKLTLAAGVLASASATQIQISAKANLQAEGVIEDIGNWFENDFVDFWTEDVPQAFDDVGDWFATDFAQFWEEDFADFWTEDVSQAFDDAGDWLYNDFTEWIYNAGEDIGEWF